MCRSLTLRSGLRKDAKPVMVCSADDLVEWRDFPKGLRVLLLDEDGPSAADTKLKLEEMDYIVSSFCSENDALEAISKKAESFHVAIVEVAAGKNHGGFRFLETAKDLPTIMISNSRCLSTMMKCIALGAAEFLQKPLSEDKLRNIWQHVVHRAFNAGGSVLSKSLKPIKETVVTMLRLQLDTAELEKGNLPEEEHTVKDEESDHENSVANDRLSAPSTPQLEQGGRLLVDGDCKDQPNCSTEKESADHVEGLAELRKFSCSESKSLENTSSSIGAVNIKEDGPSRPREAAVEEEVDSADGSKTDECSGAKEASVPSPHLHNGDNVASGAEDVKKKKSFPHRNSYSHGSRGDRQKMKVDWAPDLHRRFVQAVEQLGIDQAIPSKILELMKVEGLTRHNVASHLQKYRMHRRHILPKDDERRWQHHRSPMPRVYMQKPLVPFPPIHPNCGPPPSQAYPIWGHPGFHPYGVPMWSHAAFPTWQPPQETGLWKSYPEIHADAWGCPVVPPHGQFSVPSQIPPVSYRSDLFRDSRQSRDSYDLHLAEEVIDEVVKEAISKPWLPLPLGLKPPSTDTVLAELHRQGIITIPPPHSAS